MLVRFTDVDGCSTCTQTINFVKLRAIGMLKGQPTNESSYYVRLVFDNGDHFLARENMTLAQAIAYRNTLENYWMSGSSTLSAIH